MTGRVSGKLIFPSQDPDIEIGITLNTSPSILSLSQSTPFYLVISARILKSPIPELAITLQAHLNPFEALPNRSIINIQCVSSLESRNASKRIELWPRGWPNYNTGEKDLRKKFNYLTIQPNEIYVMYHEVLRENIESCGPVKGERFRVKLTDKALGSRFWCWGDLKDMEGVRFGAGPYSSEDFEDEGRDDWDESYGEGSVWVRGEDSGKLRLVVEKGWAEFDIL